MSEDVKVVALRRRPKAAASESCATFSPLAEMIEADDRIEIIAAVPGFEASHLAVDVLPDAIVIEGDRDEGQKLVGCLHLPYAVEARKTAAHLDDGRLTVTAPKRRARGAR